MVKIKGRRIKLPKEKKAEEKDKLLLQAEIFVGILAIVMLFGIIFVAEFIEMNDVYITLLIIFGFIVFLIPVFFALKIEQVAGYYKCKNCGNKYIPTYKAVGLAPHIGRTRYMKCPECNTYSWNKKVLKKDE